MFFVPMSHDMLAMFMFPGAVRVVVVINCLSRFTMGFSARLNIIIKMLYRVPMRMTMSVTIMLCFTAAVEAVTKYHATHDIYS